MLVECRLTLLVLMELTTLFFGCFRCFDSISSLNRLNWLEPSEARPTVDLLLGLRDPSIRPRKNMPRENVVSKSSAKRFSRKLVISFAIALIIVIWSLSGRTQMIAWQEEVLLHTGEKLIVQRTMKLSGSVRHEGGQPPGVLEYTLDFTAPDGTPVHYAGPRGLSLMILDIVDGVPYLATMPGLDNMEAKYGCPKPSYVFFRYSDGWVRIYYSEFPAKIKEKPSNLFIGSTRFRDRPQDMPRNYFLSSDFIAIKNQDFSKPNRSIVADYNGDKYCHLK